MWLNAPDQPSVSFDGIMVAETIVVDIDVGSMIGA